MAQPKRCVALAAGAAAAALFAAPAFTAPVVAESASTSLRGPSRASAQGASTKVTGTTVAAAGVLAMGAVASRGRQQKVARAGVLTKDDQGRFRFDAPEVPIVPEEQPGVTMPLGFFDPLGFSKSGLMTFPGDSTGFKHLRTAEIKHGRFAMMAATGSLFAHFVKLPGWLRGRAYGLGRPEHQQGRGGLRPALLPHRGSRGSDLEAAEGGARLLWRPLCMEAVHPGDADQRAEQRAHGDVCDYRADCGGAPNREGTRGAVRWLSRPYLSSLTFELGVGSEVPGSL